MEFTVNKSDLVRELSLSQGVVEKKTTIPILSNVLLEAADDRLTLTATDLELGIRCSCPARVKKEGAGTVPARKLLDYMRLLPDGDVNMKFLENHWASITSGRSRTRIAGMSRESFPELPADAGADRRSAGEDAGLHDRAHLVSRFPMEESRFTLNGALLLMRPEGLTMVATDGHRLAYVQASPAESGTADKPFRALIPKKAMNELTKLSDDAGRGRQGDRGGRRQSPVLPGGTPPADHAQADRQLPGLRARAAQGSPVHRQAGEGEIRSAIERVAQFADERSRAIRVQFAAGEVKVFSSSVETGESEESVSSEYNGPDIEIGFNAQYLLDFLRAIPQDQVAFELKDQKSAGEMRPAGDGIVDQYRYVVMPMRI
jgi:DNA polymerase-3 subunit beta